MGSIGHLNQEVMLDSGSSISLLAQANVEQMTNVTEKPVPKVLLRTASGIPLSVVKYVTASVLVQNMETMLHDFFVVSNLIVPAILGLDFLQQHGLVLDFSSNAVQIYPKVKHTDVGCQELQHMVEKTKSNKPHIGIIAAVNDDSSVITEECAIPNFGTPTAYELPENCGDEFRQLIKEHKDLFCTTPGKTMRDCHYIPTKGPPIRVPPRRIPGHYREEVVRQIELMLSLGVIKESSSPWMAPTVFVPKKSGELRIYVDYTELSTNSQSEILIHCHFLMRYKTVSPMLQCSPLWISTVDIGNSQWQKMINPKQHSVLGQEWVFTSFVVCHSD